MLTYILLDEAIPHSSHDKVCSSSYEPVNMNDMLSSKSQTNDNPLSTMSTELSVPHAEGAKKSSTVPDRECTLCQKFFTTLSPQQLRGRILIKSKIIAVTTCSESISSVNKNLRDNVSCLEYARNAVTSKALIN